MKPAQLLIMITAFLLLSGCLVSEQQLAEVTDGLNRAGREVQAVNAAVETMADSVTELAETVATSQTASVDAQERASEIAADVSELQGEIDTGLTAVGEGLVAVGEGLKQMQGAESVPDALETGGGVIAPYAPEVGIALVGLAAFLREYNKRKRGERVTAEVVRSVNPIVGEMTGSVKEALRSSQSPETRAVVRDIKSNLL